jgi:hypothetical protein
MSVEMASSSQGNGRPTRPLMTLMTLMTLMSLESLAGHVRLRDVRFGV